MRILSFLLVTTLLLGAVQASEIPASDQVEPEIEATVTKTVIPEPVLKPAYKVTEVAAKQEDVDQEAEASDEALDDEDTADKAKPYIGDIEIVYAQYEDTLLELGRKYNLGYVEMVAANPGVDPWLPGAGQRIVLPKRHLIPDVPRDGIVINLAEMRLYNFIDDPNNPITHPIGIGRDGLNTPTGETKVVRKKEGPTWRPTPRMRKEHPELPEAVPPGDDNPLGTHALYLGWPQYLIHGTHKPLGVGRRVSSGCIRMYPEDIITTFADVPVGTKVTVIKQPIKLAWIDDMLYMEAHAEDELADSYEDIREIKEYRVPDTLFRDLEQAAGDQKGRLDWKKIRDAVKRRSGMPVAILTGSENDVEVTEDILKEEKVTPVLEKPKKTRKVMQLNS